MPKRSSPASTTDELADSWGRRNRKLADRVCPACGSVFRPSRATSKYCSRPCLWANNGGQNRKAESWWMNSKGYVEGRVWVGDTQVAVKRHRWLMEQAIGRALRPDEDVHHVNGNKADNRLENLILIDHAAHSRLSNEGRTYRRGYRLNLSESERLARAERMRAAQHD